LRCDRAWTNPAGVDLQPLCGQFLQDPVRIFEKKLHAATHILGLIWTVVFADGPELFAYIVCIV
jgi:hypothetical protein